MVIDKVIANYIKAITFQNIIQKYKTNIRKNY